MSTNLMSLTGLTNLLKATPSLGKAVNLAAECSGPLTIEIRDAAKPAFVSALAQRSTSPIIVITAEEGRAASLSQDLRHWTDQRPVLHFADCNQPAYSMLAISSEILTQRVSVLGHLTRIVDRPEGPAPIVVTSVPALLRRLMPPAEFRTHFLVLASETKAQIEIVIRQLVTLGYVSTPLVERPREFAHRGGIIDIFPPDTHQPVRVDFFGNEIESIRRFDPETQRSVGPVVDILLTPASEIPIWLGPAVASGLKDLDLDPLCPEEQSTWLRHIEQLERSEYFDDAAFYTMSLLPEASSLFEFAPNALYVLDEPDQMAWAARSTEETATSNRDRLTANGELPNNFGSPLFEATDILPRIEQAQIGLTYVPSIPGNPSDRQRIVVDGFEAQSPYGGRLQHMSDDLLALQAKEARIVVVSHQGRRLQNLLSEHGVPSTVHDQICEPPAPGTITLATGTLAEGWRHPETNLVLVTDLEIFGSKRSRRLRQGTRSAERTFLADLEKGDFVAHIEHGIARFDGIVQVSETTGQREYLALEYLGTDRLYVPVDQINRVQKYVGMSDQEPKLSRLGTADWTRKKKQAQESAQKIAAELLDIYAAREVAVGQAFGEDSPWQQAFEEGFPFIETPDQLDAIIDVKADMEQPRPMDRLIAGDVGYGKTEVALRAVFKAAMDDKQVVVLVPTTVLAQQHHDTFSTRMRDYPLTVELLSRFRTKTEQDDVIAGLASGDVNVVIGTHRLLQDDVLFNDLGLVVVDEEQRFGVQQKERLKALRRNVDVVTLTATPIPRTLHMALSGLRGISVIESPPEHRLAIKTYVATYDDQIVANAIRSELHRGGQVYFLHNRIQTIATWAERLRTLVPEVTLLVGHGQMSANELEEVMYRFARGDAQVLLSTAIIENGLDIPNVNTIIVNDAWRFGLAQLYQLRGRVGRAKAQAYAYFLHHKNHKLTEDSQKRLQTILEASELGAGFRIAMRDLEIRGAGNLLGADQHGHVSTVGFDLYTRMLATAIDQLRGTEPDEPEDDTAVVVDLPLDAYLPDNYMGSYAAKVREYQRLARLRSMASVETAIADIRDRFGDLPEPVANVAYLLRVKSRALALGILSISTYGRELIIRLPAGKTINRGILAKTIGRNIRHGS
jgi:transcription-repair coupling factor (superfamily II helicase)